MVSGIVKDVIARPYNGKTFYSLALVNDSTYYGFGTYPPKGVVPGSKVTFQAVKNAKGYWQGDKDTLQVEAPIPEVVSVGAPALNGSTPHVGRDMYWSRKEDRDITNDELRALGAARNTAIEWVKFLVAQEALPVPKTVAAREDSLNKVLNDYTRLFMSGIEGLVSETDSELENSEPKKRGRPAKAIQEPTAPTTPKVVEAELPWE